MRVVNSVVISRRSSRLTVIAICVACAAALIDASGRMWMAAHLAAGKDPADWTRAAQIESGNAGYWSQLGLYQEWNFEHGSVQQAIRYFRMASQLNPHSPMVWTDLASAYEVAGQPSEARLDYEKARAAAPVSAEVAWQYGSFLLRQGETQEAAAQVRKALLNRPDLAPSAVPQFWEAGVGLDPILDQVLPPTRGNYLAALNYFVSQQDYDEALACWGKLELLGRSLPLSDSMDLVNRLIALERIEDAERVWQQALALAGRSGEINPGGSLVFNGRFEHALVNDGFGWRWYPGNGFVLDIVSDITHNSTQAARVVFDGTANLDFSSLRQYIAVTPRESYRFSVFMRTDAVSTDSGLRFAIRTCADPHQDLAETAAMTGTHPWAEQEAAFSTGADVHCVEIALVRRPSQMFDNRISGTVWVDNVRLLPAPAGGSPLQ